MATTKIILKWEDVEAYLAQHDIVKVVRCKDCKHSDYWYKDKRRCFLWHEAGIDVFEDGFCSYGERRDDG